MVNVTSPPENVRLGQLNFPTGHLKVALVLRRGKQWAACRAKEGLGGKSRRLLS